MGLLKMAGAAIGSTFADQVKEYIYCDSIGNDVLVAKGRVRKNSGNKFGMNNKGTDNVITQGSTICVADGQCMLIVEDGKIVEVCAEPGYFTFDSSTEPTVFEGSLGEGIKNTFATIGKRFTYGGLAAKDQRVYFINTRQIRDNKFGTPSAIPYRDPEFGLSIKMTCNGIYRFIVSDPLVFYTKICGNIEGDFEVAEISSDIRNDLVAALRPALASANVCFDQITTAEKEITREINAQLYESWTKEYGIQITAVSILNTSPVEDENYKKLLNFQSGRVYTNQAMAQAMQSQSQVGWIDGMGQGAAKGGSQGGDPMGGAMNMMAMNMMGNMMNGGMQQQPMYQQPMQQQPMQQPVQQQPAQPAAAGWNCSCGKTNITSKFCPECGSKQKVFKCDKCGWAPAEGTTVPKFCPECGDPVNEQDFQ